ncbi:MAG: sensor domain-containing diguanylate cyclase [Aliivibrio sp.]|uniref:transporter substrate-binding domain-containing diguanylate cyclase n=1 Tax=Aliivibrio sp. TaxID=1872443 RepID=UPI001A5BCAE1|nr:sensor domain-containing diguanylate cyclase [Aliivibrio sp.]
MSFFQFRALMGIRPVYVALLLSCMLITPSISANQEDEITKPLRVTNSKAWIPFSYEGKNGEPKGILIDFWKEYGKRTGREIEFILTDWNESIDLLKRGEADVHAGMLWSEKREAMFDFADTFTSITTHLYFDNHIADNSVESYLFGDEGGALGLVYGGYEQDFIENNYPKVKLALFSNNEEMLEAALNHKIEAFVADLQVANFYLQTSSIKSRKGNSFVPVRYLYTGNVRPAVLAGNTALLSSVIKEFQPIIFSDRDRILNRWINFETVYPPYLVPLVSGFLILVTMTYIFQLNKTVKNKTKALQKANDQLIYLTQTDELTKIYNRRFFLEKLASASNQSRNVSVIVFDIDDFKKINDTFGHTIGDRAIQLVVSKVESVIPQDFLLARIGGEEFAIYIEGHNFTVVSDFSKQICSAIEKINLEPLGVTGHVTVSLGSAFYATAPSNLTIHDADILMYQAKENGKNQAVIKQL